MKNTDEIEQGEYRQYAEQKTDDGDSLAKVHYKNILGNMLHQLSEGINSIFDTREIFRFWTKLSP